MKKLQFLRVALLFLMVPLLQTCDDMDFACEGDKPAELKYTLPPLVPILSELKVVQDKDLWTYYKELTITDVCASTFFAVQYNFQFKHVDYNEPNVFENYCDIDGEEMLMPTGNLFKDNHSKILVGSQVFTIKKDSPATFIIHVGFMLSAQGKSPTEVGDWVRENLRSFAVSIGYSKIE